MFPGRLFHAGHAATTMCHGDDFLVEASLEARGSLDSDGCFLKHTMRWVEHIHAVCCLLPSGSQG